MDIDIEDEAGLPFPPPLLELTINPAALNIQKAQLPTGEQVVLLSFITPAMAISLRLDADRANELADNLRTSPVTIARVVPR